MNDTAKYTIMRNALRAEREVALTSRNRHTADALSELLLAGMPRLVSLYNRLDDAMNNRPVGGA